MEKINKMRECPEYTETQAKLHEEHGLHFTNGVTWQPATGNHPQYDLHVEWCELLGINKG